MTTGIVIERNIYTYMPCSESVFRSFIIVEYATEGVDIEPTDIVMAVLYFYYIVLDSSIYIITANILQVLYAYCNFNNGFKSL
jgi:hypothetical protein